MQKQVENIISDCCVKLRSIDYNSLELSDYNLNYIFRMLPHLEYYFSMYAFSLSVLMGKSLKKEDEYVVDFGGGHGFLSIFLKMLGLNVIYCDYNPLSVQAIKKLKETIGYGPDLIVDGSSAELLSFCAEKNLQPKYILSIDVIEHVYDLDGLFRDFHAMNPSVQMVFTTASNPCNFLKAKQLRKIMQKDEQTEFFHLRFEYIKQNFPQLPDNTCVQLSKLTRGLCYDDIETEVEKYIKTGVLPKELKDKFNTCDPITKSWTERILSLKEYRRYLKKYSFEVNFHNGFYNPNRSNKYLSYAVKYLNFIILHTGFAGRTIAPFILLKIKAKVSQ